MNWLIAAGGVGGFLTLMSVIVMIGRGIFKQINAVDELTGAVKDLASEMHNLRAQYNHHETRISVLEDRVKR